MQEASNTKSFEWQVMERLIKIEEKLDGYVEFKKRFYDAERTIDKLTKEIEKNQEHIRELQNRNQWLGRTVTAAVITSLVGVIFCFIKLGMGI